MQGEESDCPGCGAAYHPGLRADDAIWNAQQPDCPICLQRALLETRLRRGHSAMHEFAERLWPVDHCVSFRVLPTPLRLHADPRFTGKGVTIAQIDSGFYPHADLVRPANRIRAWADAAAQSVRSMRFQRNEHPAWPGWNRLESWQWHGLMTTASAFGNGRLSNGLYRGIACDAELVLVQTWNRRGRITNATLERALGWIHKKRKELQIRIVSISVAGDPVPYLPGNAVDEAVRRLVEDGVMVIAASGNKLERQMVPPATAEDALTVGGLDDRNVFDRNQHEVWHSNYYSTLTGALKPEVIAPSLWVVAPVLPGSSLAREATELFSLRAQGDAAASAKLAQMKMVSPCYQHVEGTSFAAPIVAGIAACMLEANPGLTPSDLKRLLMAAAYKVPGAPDERQGAGAVDAGQAISLALDARQDHSSIA